MNIINYSFNVKESYSYDSFIKSLKSFGKTETNGDFLTLTLKDNAGVLVFNLKVRSIQAQKVRIEEIDFQKIKNEYFEYLAEIAKASESIKESSLIKTNDKKMASNIMEMNRINYVEQNGDIFVEKGARIESSKKLKSNCQEDFAYVKYFNRYNLKDNIDIDVEDRITNLSYGSEVTYYTYEYNEYKNIRSWGEPADLFAYQGSYYFWDNDFNNGLVFDISNNHKVICVGRDKFVDGTLKETEHGVYHMVNETPEILWEDNNDQRSNVSYSSMVSSYEETPNGYRLDPYEVCYLSYGGFNIRMASENPDVNTYKFGDILAINRNNEIIGCSFDEYRASDYIPIGVCCIPSNILPDNKARFIAIKGMSDEKFIDSVTGLPYRKNIRPFVKATNNSDIISLDGDKKVSIGTDSSGRYQSDLNTYIYYQDTTGIPPLYYEDWSLNHELFDQNTYSYSLLQDYDGKYNTAYILTYCSTEAGLAQEVAEYKIYSSAEKGKWYIPSITELMLCFTRFKALFDVYKDLNFELSDKIYWSSTPHDNSHIYRFNVNEQIAEPYEITNPIDVYPFFMFD